MSAALAAHSLHSLLDAAGYRIRGRRADCRHCDGHSRLTVSFNDECFYCHRCGRGGNARTLARDLGKPLPPETLEQRAARERAAQFRTWIDQHYRTVATEFRSAGRLAQRAKQALSQYPDCEPAWNALAHFYHSEAKLSAALETLSFERAPQWLESPATPETLFHEYEDACEHLTSKH
jgi:hypothetical protein